MNEGEAARALALKWTRALESCDSDGVRECYAPDMRFWHNCYEVELTGEEHIRLMEKRYFYIYRNPKYINIHIELIDGGFVQQHILTARLANEEIYQPICFVARLNNGRFTRIDEYLTAAPATLGEF